MAASTPDPMPEASLPKDGNKATMDVVDDDEEEEEVSAGCCVLDWRGLDIAGNCCTLSALSFLSRYSSSVHFIQVEAPPSFSNSK